MNELQYKVKTFCTQHNLESPPEHRVLDALAELGEVAKEILKMSDYGRQPLCYRDELKLELGDVVYSIMTIANYFDVDIDEAVNLVLAKYEQRLGRGGAGSEHGESGQFH